MTFKMLGNSEFDQRNDEIISIKSLSRGAYAKEEIKKGSTIDSSKIFYAFPLLKDNQHTSSSISFPSTALKNINKNESLLEDINIKSPKINPNSYLKTAIHEIKALLAMGSIHLNSTFSLELSHHKGPENFKKIGTTIINCINREYCKKILVQLPNQLIITLSSKKKKLSNSYEICKLFDGHKYSNETDSFARVALFLLTNDN